MVDIILKLSEIYEKIENAISKSSTPGLVKNNGDIDTNSYIHTAGTSLTKEGNTIKHNDSGVTATTTTALKSIKYDAQGHITGVANPPQASIASAGIVQLGTDETNAAQGNHTHSYISTNPESVQSSHIASNAIETSKIKNGNVTWAKLNSDVYDNTFGGTNGSSKLISSNAVYQGLAKRLPTTGNGTTTGTITAAGFKINNQTGFLKANGTVDGTINLNELNDDVYDTTVGGTNESSKLITSNAVYQGLAKRLPTTGNGTTTGTITAAGFKINNQTGFLKADGTVDTSQYVDTTHHHIEWETIPITYLDNEGNEKPNNTNIYGLKIKGLVNKKIGLAQIRIGGIISSNAIVKNTSQPQLANFSDSVTQIYYDMYAPNEGQSIYSDIHPSGNLKMRVMDDGIYLIDNTLQSTSLTNINVYGTVMYVTREDYHFTLPTM